MKDITRRMVESYFKLKYTLMRCTLTSTFSHFQYKQVNAMAKVDEVASSLLLQ